MDTVFIVIIVLVLIVTVVVSIAYYSKRLEHYDAMNRIADSLESINLHLKSIDVQMKSAAQPYDDYDYDDREA